MGIPIEEFWKLNPKYMYMYQENFIKEKEEQIKLLDVSAYYQGLYVQQAIASCFNKGTKYPRKPLSLVEKEKPMSGEEQFKLWAAEFNRKFKKSRD